MASNGNGGRKGDEGAPVPTKTKSAPIVKQGQTVGRRYGQNATAKGK